MWHREHQGNANAVEGMLHEEIKRREEDAARRALELDGLRDAHQAALSQARSLMEQLAQKDATVSAPRFTTRFTSNHYSHVQESTVCLH